MYPDQEIRPQRKKPTPLVLAVVCQQWRQIVLATPRLWTVASIKIAKRAVKPCAQMTQEWLRRSGRLPLSLEIYEEKPRPTFMSYINQRSAVDPTPIFEAVNAHMHHVRSLEVHFDMKCLPFLRGEAWTMRNLYLSITGGQGGPPPAFV
ncbi:unnamed protein product [Cyclocybe aegerita]|uniref:F-box domain-containing protein n=1 Tax=Cyclocybe aegerita TaxID=1973307 RepID=A0A8S0WN17_CYCAE|nr:unnamed protein product [Cyclocybe aegerita]